MPLSKQLQHFATTVAVGFRKNQPPLLTDKMMGYMDDHPQELLDMLDALVNQVATEGDDNLTQAYLMLLGVQLEHIRYQVDRDYDWAKELIARFQQQVIELADTGRLSDMLLQQIIVSLREARLQVDPRLFQAVTAAMETEAKSNVEVPDLDGLLASLARDAGSDEFQVAAMATELTYPMPVEMRLTLAAAMLHSSYPILQNTVPLLLLDDMEPMRQGVMQMLQQGVKQLTPVGLRRLIAIRNWLFPHDRSRLDPVIKVARQRGIECAQWESGRQAEIYGTMVDGSGAMGFMIVTVINRKYMLSSILVRLHAGVLDAWIDPEPHSKRTINQYLSQVSQSRPLIVSRAYLDRAVQHHLAVGGHYNRLPLPGLLAVAERLGATDWQPDELNLEATIDRLFEELPEQHKQADVIEYCLQESHFWSIVSGATHSWFEDDQQVAELLAASRARKQHTLVKQVLREVIEPHRLRWAEKSFWAALWFRDSQGLNNPFWINFLQVARALVKGRSVETIPMMENIARLTVQNLGH